MRAGQEIDRESVRISVNESPAIHAKQVVNKKDQPFGVLKGDAALGLSYFKGLNAGYEASARFLTMMAPIIQDSFLDKKKMETQLNQYQAWFVNDFSPKKVSEVDRYSFWQIRSFMKMMRAVSSLKNVSKRLELEPQDAAISDYFNYGIAKQKWRPFPHRKYDLLEFQFDYIPLHYTTRKISKLFTEYFKPYRGCIEIITTPLTWFIKPLTRGIATLFHGGYAKIEENSGMQYLAQFGLDYLSKTSDSCLARNKSNHELLSICHDIHWKFDKACVRQQPTELAVDEYQCYCSIRGDYALDREKLNRYFSLFAPTETPVVQV